MYKNNKLIDNKKIYIGPKGGKYYMKNNNKIYIKNDNKIYMKGGNSNKPKIEALGLLKEISSLSPNNKLALNLITKKNLNKEIQLMKKKTTIQCQILHNYLFIFFLTKRTSNLNICKPDKDDKILMTINFNNQKIYFPLIKKNYNFKEHLFKLNTKNILKLEYNEEKFLLKIKYSYLNDSNRMAIKISDNTYELEDLKYLSSFIEQEFKNSDIFENNILNLEERFSNIKKKFKKIKISYSDIFIIK